MECGPATEIGQRGTGLQLLVATGSGPENISNCGIQGRDLMKRAEAASRQQPASSETGDSGQEQNGVGTAVAGRLGGSASSKHFHASPRRAIENGQNPLTTRAILTKKLERGPHGKIKA
jgi:hypothetical protein